MSKRTLDKRDIPGALLAGARWLMNPVSEGGAKQVPRIKMLAAGPELLADIERMRLHPTGKRILAERPDLGAALSDSATLKAMPIGSLGRTFVEAMDIPGGVPGFLLAALIYKDGLFDSFEMSDDAQYYLARSRWLHDLFHIVTWFGTDLPGEGLLIYFALGYEHHMPYWAASLTPLGIGPRFFIRPSGGQRRWRGLLRDAHARGLAANKVCPPQCVPWEELLPRPLDEVRQQLGVVPFVEDTSRWLDSSWFGRQAANGFGAYAKSAERAQVALAIVRAGVDYRDLYRFSDEKARELASLVSSGACANPLIASSTAIDSRSTPMLSPSSKQVDVGIRRGRRRCTSCMRITICSSSTSRRARAPTRRHSCPNAPQCAPVPCGRTARAAVGRLASVARVHLQLGGRRGPRARRELGPAEAVEKNAGSGDPAYNKQRRRFPL